MQAEVKRLNKLVKKSVRKDKRTQTPQHPDRVTERHIDIHGATGRYTERETDRETYSPVRPI